MFRLAFLNRFFIRMILVIRPLLGPSSCRYCVSCTDYAVNQFTTQRVDKAFLRSMRRVLLCMPFTSKKWIQRFE
jgi:putative component of membrane protein insertase Oxa1/YidC/SpoIIIJ protein YidD